jgi:hypothetical protein
LTLHPVWPWTRIATDICAVAVVAEVLYDASF